MTYAAPDGYKRTNDEEAEINQMVAKVLDNPDGHALLSYLESVTVKTVVPPSAEPHQFAYMEGRRDLYRVLLNRVEDGKAGRPSKETPDGRSQEDHQRRR